MQSQLGIICHGKTIDIQVGDRTGMWPERALKLDRLP
jgi:hypothetical protein